MLWHVETGTFFNFAVVCVEHNCGHVSFRGVTVGMTRLPLETGVR